MRLSKILFLVSIFAVGCRPTEPKQSFEAIAGSDDTSQLNTDPKVESHMADLPDWVVAAHSNSVGESGRLNLSFYGSRRIDDARSLELLSVLTNLDRLDDLESFSVTDSPINDASFTEWAKAAQQGKLTALRFLEFGGTRVSDKSSVEWAKAAQMGQLENLETLQLFKTQIGDSSMIEWARAAQLGKLTNLSELWLIETSVGDESMTEWAKAAHSGYLKKLERLALYKTQVGDKTLAEWAKAVNAGNLPNLLTFWLKDTNVSAFEIKGLRVEVPKAYLEIGQAQHLFAWIREQRD